MDDSDSGSGDTEVSGLATDSSDFTLGVDPNTISMTPPTIMMPAPIR
jgi:hypothetical protein